MTELSNCSTTNPLHERYYNVLGKPPQGTMYDYLRSCNQGYDSEIAFEYLGARVTYGKLFRMIEKTARAMLSRGVQPGDTVAVVMPSQPETYYILYACSAIGAAACLIDLRYPKDYLLDAITKSGAVLSFVSTATGDALAELGEDAIAVETGESVGIADFLANERIRQAAKTAPQNKLEDFCPSWKDFLRKSPASTDLPDYAPGRTVVMVGTGGTTGTPKLVELSNEAVNAAVFQCRNANFDFRRGDVWYDIMPPFIAYGAVDGLHLPLTLGMKTVLEPAPSVDNLVSVFRSETVHHMAASPAFYIDLARRQDVDDLDLSMLRSPIVGGRSVNAPQERRINRFLAARGCHSRLLVGWGLTETCGAISVAGTGALAKEQSCGITLTGGITSAFHEVPDGDSTRFEELPYVEAGSADVPEEKTGELWYTGPNVMTGYYGNADETAHSFVEFGGRRWLRTGDVGYVDSDGSIFITNRIKDFIARKDGFKTPPKEIEDVVVSIGGIDEVAAVDGANPADDEDTLIVVFYTKLKESMPDSAIEQAAREAVAKRLAEYKWPDLYVAIEKMPYTPIGKVDRKQLRSMAAKALKAMIPIR